MCHLEMIISSLFYLFYYTYLCMYVSIIAIFYSSMYPMLVLSNIWLSTYICVFKEHVVRFCSFNFSYYLTLNQSYKTIFIFNQCYDYVINQLSCYLFSIGSIYSFFPTFLLFSCLLLDLVFLIPFYFIISFLAISHFMFLLVVLRFTICIVNVCQPTFK